MENIEQRVRAGRIEALIGQQPMGMLANLVNSALLGVVLYPAWPSMWLSAWIGTVWVFTLLRGAIWVVFRGTLSDPRMARRAGRFMVLLSGASGLLWGLPCVIFFPETPLALQGFIVFVLGGMSAGAIATLASHLPAFFAFLVPVLLPMVGRLLLEGGALHFSMGAMGLVYFAVLSGAGLNLNRTLTRQLSLQIEKSALVDSLTEARNQAEAANRAKSAFLATVSHELRTPLNAVLGFAQVLEREVHGPLGHGSYRDYLLHIKTSGGHLLSLINSLLDLSRAEDGRLELNEEALDLASVLDDCVARATPLAQHAGIELVTAFEADLPGLRADLDRLRQIFLNILSNAINCSPPGEAVEFRAGYAEDGGVRISMHDRGIGMTEQDVKTAMEFFGRTDNSHSRASAGTGIGLPFTALLMELHGGEVEIESEPGSGTEVTLRFPADRVIDRPEAAPSSQEKPQQGRQRA
ncbi:MAG: HAMP domain-containing histidine kinase [Rhodospirillales bacterium]|nr:HAMP domain-containing histidine kinase [Rhodospirillales bacterium]